MRFAAKQNLQTICCRIANTSESAENGLSASYQTICMGFIRHTIGEILRNKAKNPSLNVLDKICGYLIDNGVPFEILPGPCWASSPQPYGNRSVN
jgi:hypothetical protein